MVIKRIESFKIEKSLDRKIETLLQSSFSSFPANQTFFNQIPHFRYLVFDGEKLIGHMAVIHRLINLAGEHTSIFGIADFCVDSAYQSKNIATDLLVELSNLAESHTIDFLVLISGEHGLYRKNGFDLVKNTCRWLMINDYKTLGVGHRKFHNCLMVKAVGTRKWKEGLVDFLGHMF